jgi:anti-sigma-K factor RskA
MTDDELIGSGLLEAYVLGQTTAGDSALVEHARNNNDRVRAELEAIERSLEDMAMKRAQAPPLRTRAALLKEVGHPQGTQVLPLKPVTATSNTSRWLAAASVIALAGSVGMNIHLYRNMERLGAQVARYEAEHQQWAEAMKVEKASLQGAQAQLAVVMDPHRKVIGVNGTALDPTGAARVYWDPTTHEVHLQVIALPTPEAGRQYQLWALADGVPIDAGVFTLDGGLQQMHAISSAQAFAVTLEKAGGVPSPTLSAMHLMGQVG